SSRVLESCDVSGSARTWLAPSGRTRRTARAGKSGGVSGGPLLVDGGRCPLVRLIHRSRSPGWQGCAHQRVAKRGTSPPPMPTGSPAHPPGLGASTGRRLAPWSHTRLGNAPSPAEHGARVERGPAEFTSAGRDGVCHPSERGDARRSAARAEPGKSLRVPMGLTPSAATYIVSFHGPERGSRSPSGRTRGRLDADVDEGFGLRK